MLAQREVQSAAFEEKGINEHSTELANLAIKMIRERGRKKPLHERRRQDW